MRIIILADLLIIIIFSLIENSKPILKFDKFDYEGFIRSTVENQEGYDRTIPIKYDGIERYVVGELYNRITANTFVKCLKKKECTLVIQFTPNGMKIKDDEFAPDS